MAEKSKEFADHGNRVYLPLARDVDVNYLPLTPPGQTPLRVMTIAGLRLRRRRGHPGRPAHVRDARRARLRRGHRGDGAELVGVKGFHEIPLDVIAGQIEAVARTSACRPPRPGCWPRRRSSTPSPRPGAGLDDARAAGRRPGVRVDARRSAAAPVALDALRTELFPMATLVTPNLDEVRLLVDIDVVDADVAARAARALHALGPQWALVKGGHLRSSAHSADVLFDGTDFYEFDAERIDTGHDHGAGDTLAAATRMRAGARLFGARCGAVRQTVGHRMSARRLPVGPRPRPGLRPVSARPMNLDAIAGIAHRPDGDPKGAIVLTHGAGGNRESPLLIRLCDEWARRGLARGALRPAVPAAQAEGPAVRVGGRRSGGHRGGRRTGPRR